MKPHINQRKLEKNNMGINMAINMAYINQHIYIYIPYKFPYKSPINPLTWRLSKRFFFGIRKHRGTWAGLGMHYLDHGEV